MGRVVRRPALALWMAAGVAMMVAACGGGEPVSDPSGRARPLSAGAAPAGSTITYYTAQTVGTVSGTAPRRGVNAGGQVASTDFDPSTGQFRAFFFDGLGSTNLGVLSGTSGATASALNANGQVVGWTNFPLKSFSWTAATGMQLVKDGGVAQGVNDSGLVVGVSGAVPNTTAYSWTQPGGLQDFAGFLRFDDVNNAGTVVGAESDPSLFARAVIRKADGNVVPLWTGAEASYGRFITNSGWAAGYAGGAFFFGRPFAWKDGVAYDVQAALTAAGYGTGSITDLGDGGQLVGSASSLATGAQSAFAWTAAGLVALQGDTGSFPSASARAVNKYGVVVGQSSSSVNPPRAVAWLPSGGMVDLLPRVLNATAGLQLFDANSISDAGHIVVRSSSGLLLLTPVVPGTPVAPMVGNVTTNDPVPVGMAMGASATFTDFNADDTHTAQWDWGDGTSSAGTVTESGGSGSVAGSHVYTNAGLYRVTLTVTDSGGKSATTARDVVVYDPNGGFVAGGGWFDSPQGAYSQDFFATGRAEFAFLSKYQKGANVPTGNTLFRFQTVGLVFTSDRYEWLVVAGARAQYKGQGTLNGQPGYRFMLTAIDGDKLGGGTPDRFRIRIWFTDPASGIEFTAYDNQVDGSGVGGNTEGTVLGGGNIAIAKD